MQDINVSEGQAIMVGDASIKVERIDFNSRRSFIVYSISEDNSSSSKLEQVKLYTGELIQLMPQVLLKALRIVRGKETYAVMGFDTPADISVMS